MCLLEVNENEVSVRPVSYLLPPPINAPLWDKSFTDRRVNVIGTRLRRSYSIKTMPCTHTCKFLLILNYLLQLRLPWAFTT